MTIPQVYTRDHLLYHPVWWRRQPWGSIWGSSGFCRPHTQKYTQNKCVYNLWVPCGVCLSSCSNHIRTWRTTVILITGKTQRPPNSAPCRDQDGECSGISGLYLWTIHIFTDFECFAWKELPQIHERVIKLCNTYYLLVKHSLELTCLKIIDLHVLLHQCTDSIFVPMV